MKNIIQTKICAFLSLGIKLFSFFDIRPTGGKWILKITKLLCILIFLGISSYFAVQTVTQANKNDLWSDERNGLAGRQVSSYSDLIRGDMGSQISKAPLDYIALKLFDEVGVPLISERVSPNLYYRLNSIFYNWFSGLLIIFLAFFHIKGDTKNYLVFGVQMLFLGAALYFYYFWPSNFRYSLEMRPYALWNSLWFMILALFLIYKHFRWPIIILLILLAATANVAVFQIGSLAGGFLIIKLLQKERFQDVSIKILKVFSIPLAVSLYYIWIGNLQVYGWHGDYEKYMKEFFHFWLTKEMIPILSVLGILMTAPFKKLHDHTIVFSSILILYLISPLINYLVLNKRVFFSSRHYLYYDLIYPIFFINIALVMPIYWERIKQRYPNNNINKAG